MQSQQFVLREPIQTQRLSPLRRELVMPSTIPFRILSFGITQNAPVDEAWCEFRPAARTTRLIRGGDHPTQPKCQRIVRTAMAKTLARTPPREGLAVVAAKRGSFTMSRPHSSPS